MKKFLVLVLWFGIGFINYGFNLGGFTHRFPDQRNMTPAVMGFILGPMAVPATAVVIGYNHWLLVPYTKEQRWEYFNQMYPDLGRDYFERDDN